MIERLERPARTVALALGFLTAAAVALPRGAHASPLRSDTANARSRVKAVSNGPSARHEKRAADHPKTATVSHSDAGRRARSNDAPKDKRAHAKPRAAAKHLLGSHHICQQAPVTIERPELHEMASVALTDCDGKPRREAQRTLSSLARLRGTARPKQAKLDGAADDGESIDRGVALMHHGLLERLQIISDHFPNKTISIVSGYRPQSAGSLHQRARAVDIRVEGVDNVTLVNFCRTMADSGCGYYPNSSFVHVDVRPVGSGKVTWIDASGPGEKPRYVSRWPETSSHLAGTVGSNDGDDPYIEAPTLDPDPDH